jgi:RNA polymerase sigma factor (sigma-70 family)
MQLVQYTDNQLVENYRRTHDARYIGDLYRRYSHLIYGVCLKYLKNQADSEDAVMEIFEKLHLDLKKVEVEHIKSWLYTVARNHCLMKLRKAGLDVEYPEELPAPPQYDADMEALEDKETLIQLLENSMTLLKPEQRLCIELFFLQDKSYKQIATETNLSLNDIKTHIQNGKLNLKKMMAKYRGE